jgi:hypothetical protein
MRGTLRVRIPNFKILSQSFSFLAFKGKPLDMVQNTETVRDMRIFFFRSNHVNYNSKVLKSLNMIFDHQNEISDQWYAIMPYIEIFGLWSDHG